MSKNKENEEKNAEDINHENNTSELSYLTKETTKIHEKKKKYNDYRDEIANMNDNEIKEAIRDFEPIPILDFPKIPYKSIFIILLLFFSSILFIYTGIVKYKDNDKMVSLVFIYAFRSFIIYSRLLLWFYINQYSYRSQRI